MLSSRQGKMSEEDRRTVFRRGVQGACAEELFPQQMAIDPCQPEEPIRGLRALCHHHCRYILYRQARMAKCLQCNVWLKIFAENGTTRSKIYIRL